MVKFTRALCAGVVLLLAQAALAESEATYKLESPDHHITSHFKIGRYLAELGVPIYDVSLNGERLLGNSRLGIEFQGSGVFKDLRIKRKNQRTADTTYSMPFGKSSSLRDHYNEYSFLLEESKAPHRKFSVIFRLYNDGLAFRYEFPKQAAFSDFVISNELTSFRLENDPKMFAIPLNFQSSYEWYYKIGKIADFYHGQTLLLPMMLEFPNQKYIGLTEASLTDYAGMYAIPSDQDANTLDIRLAPWLNEPEVKVRAQTPFQSPWRTLMIGNSPKTMLESDLVYNLNAPSVIMDTSWIKPGKIQFPWWNGYIVPSAETHSAGVNTWTIKRYIDFCADNNITYHSIDGFDKAWYGGPVDPYQAPDVTHAIPELNLTEVLSYAKSKNVGTRLWMHSAGLAQNLESTLATYENWGVSGIMIDFLNRDDQQMVQFYHDVLVRTAKHHLTVNFHGVSKPTGLGRTFPNLLNHEAVLGTEYNKWSETGSTPEHEVLVAYIRMMAGPLDTHQGSFRPVAPKDYKMSWLAPRAMGTLARQLAVYVVYENHLPMLADYPEAYLAHPDAFHFVQQVPVVWDETRMLAGELGEFITIGRRSGVDWYLGTITDKKPRNFKLPLTFLGTGHFKAEVYADATDSEVRPEDIVIKEFEVTAKDELDVSLVAAGGHAIRFHPMP